MPYDSELSPTRHKQLDRRRLLQLAASYMMPGAALFHPPKAQARELLSFERYQKSRATQMPKRGGLIVLNPVLALNLIVLGKKDFGMTQTYSYESMVTKPVLPSEVYDVGSSSEPNLELLAQIAPRMILYSREMPPDPTPLKKIAPVIDIPILSSNNPVKHAKHMLQKLGEIVDSHTRVTSYFQEFEFALNQARIKARGLSNPRVLCFSSPSRRGAYVFCRGSLFDAVLNDIGLHNAIEDEGDFWGWKPIGLDRLLDLGNVWAIHAGPLSKNGIYNSPFWRALPFIQRKQLMILPKIYPWGGLPSALEFAEAIGNSAVGRG